MERKELQFLPVSLNVTNKKILLVGGGKVATHKGAILARFVSDVTVISPEFTDEIRQLPYTFIEKPYEKKDLEGFFLVYVCTGHHELNSQIKADAEDLGILASVCDAPLLCDFVSPAIHKQGNITISVGSNAQNVYQSVAIRNRITQLITEGMLSIDQVPPTPTVEKSYILNILKVIIRKGTSVLKQVTGFLDYIPKLKKRLKVFSFSGFQNKVIQPGKVTLVGFGPGNPDLLTLGGERALAQSDIIFHDDLLDIAYLKKYRAEKVYVGKRKGHHHIEQDEINQLLLHAAKAGKKVVRLKGGDPMIFAHGGEEVEYLERNLIPVEVIPGVSAGVAVSSLLKVPLTHRGISSSVAFISGHSKNVALPDADTLVIYMGGSNIRTIARNAIAQGRDLDIPVMLVHNLSLPGQQEFFFTLGELAFKDQNFPTPVIIVMGEVVSFRNRSVSDASRNNRRDSLSTIHPYSDPINDKSLGHLTYTNLQRAITIGDTMEKQRVERRPVAAIKISEAGKKTKEAVKEYGS